MNTHKIKFNILSERLKLIYSTLWVGNIGMVSTALILTIILRDDIPQLTLFLWFSAMLLNSIVTLLNNHWYLKDIQRETFEPKKWEKILLIHVTINGLIWGASSFILFPIGSLAHQALLVLILIGVVGGAIGMLSPSLKAMYIFMPLCLLPLANAVLTKGILSGISSSTMILIYLVVSLYNGVKYYQRLTVQFNLQNEAITREKVIIEEKIKYQVLYENSEDAMMIFRGEEFVMANQAAVKVFGYDSLETLLKSPAFDTSPKYQPDGQESRIKAKKHGKIVSELGSLRFEWMYKKQDGEVRPADITMSLVPYKDGYAVFSILRDIKESKNLQENLIKAKIESEAANNAKSEFLANMSHEIRTPMNGVIGINNLMLQHPLSNDQKLRAIAIQNSADSMLTIINDILDFSKIEAGKLNIEMFEFNIKNLIQIISSSVRNRVDEKNLKYKCLIDPELDQWYLGDSTRIRQVLDNLLNNAIKFTSSGSITLKCTIDKDNKKHSQLKVEIIDTGIGISEHRQETIFNRFIQADGSTTRKFGGTGLGLSISKQLIDLMDGKIGCESSENHGSNFWITLKLNKTNAPKILEVNKKIINKNIVGTVLIVDDNKVNRMVVQGMMDLYEIKSDLVEDGEQAIAAIKNKHYDLILMDCHMPIMDGYEATRIIRKNELNLKTRIPIIAVTASAMKGDRDKCLACGMDDYITKPIEIDALQNKLSQWL